MTTKNKAKNLTTFFILSFILIMGGNIHGVYAEDLSRLSDYSIKLSITPSHVYDDSTSHPIGYVYVLNKNGIPITSSTDQEILLKSDNPSIASVPEKIILEADAPFAKFDVT